MLVAIKIKREPESLFSWKVMLNLCKVVAGGAGTMALATEEALWTSAFPPGNNKSETENADCC